MPRTPMSPPPPPKRLVSLNAAAAYLRPSVAHSPVQRQQIELDVQKVPRRRLHSIESPGRLQIVIVQSPPQRGPAEMGAQPRGEHRDTRAFARSARAVRACSGGPPCDIGAHSCPAVHQRRCCPLARPRLAVPGGGGGVVAAWAGLLRLTHPPTHPPTSAKFPHGTNEIDQRGPKLEVDVRYTDPGL